MTNNGLTLLTDDQLEAMWVRAGLAQDFTMVDFCERAMDGSDFHRRQCTLSARDVAIYAEVVK